MTPLRFKSSVLILLFLSLSSCAAKETAPPIFTEIPAGKTTGSASHFELIDDFNAGIGKTRLGSEWQASDLDGVKLRLFADREDAVKYGGSMGIEYAIPAQQSAHISTPLNGKDMSQAQFFAFLVRKSDWDLFRGKISIELADMKGNKIAVDLKKANARFWKGPQGEWLEVAVPRAAFQTLDFNQLDRFDLILTASSKQATGSLSVDEIAFFGPEDLVFQSDRDNLTGFVTQAVNEGRKNKVQDTRDDKQFLTEIARDTWFYFKNAADRDTTLVVDHIRTGDVSGIGSYTTPTNVALYWLANVAAFDLSLITKEEAVKNIQASLTTLDRLERWHGFWFNYYQTHNLRVSKKYVSTVDNGWLAAGLIVIRDAFPESFNEKATALLKELNFSEFYDNSNGQLKLGFDADKNVFSRYHYGLLATEARLASFVAIGKNDLEKEHWARIYRTLPPEWDWQKQIPQGSEQMLFGVLVFEGFYTYLNKKFIPSWGGSLFEFLSPTLLIKEQELAPEGLGKNNLVVTDLHIDDAHQKGYPVWGMAPCAIRNGKYWIYREYGVTELGAKGYPDRGVVTPYVSFLALATRPEAAVQNLRQMLKLYPDIYGEYGFYDSVDVTKGNVNYQYLALDQGMSLVAIANYVKDGAIRERFHHDPVGQHAEQLLKEEKFSI